MITNITIDQFAFAALGFILGFYFLAPALRQFMGLDDKGDQ